ncbi:HAD family hydrolase [bacterium]|nr:MAG: HAD family hydrolase [bacterium]
MGGPIAAFLDRDGTLNEEVNFVRTPEALELLPGAAASVRALNERGIIVCVISNQSGVARGFFTEEDLVPIHAKLERELDRAGAWIDHIYYCPHHPTEGKPPYNIVCACRKPETGMLRQAAQDFGLDLQRSFVVGDRIVDIQAGRAAGATTILVMTGYGPHALKECHERGIVPDVIAADIAEAVTIIMQKTKGETPEND